MNGREIIKAIMEEKGITNAQFAEMLGITQAALWDRLNNKKVKDIPLNLFVDMLRYLGYSAYAVPVSNNQRMPDGARKVVEPKAERGESK
jgi:transcriptional regulator with XRE-family HTH domain